MSRPGSSLTQSSPARASASRPSKQLTPSVAQKPERSSALRREFASSEQLLQRTLGPLDGEDVLQQQVLARLLGSDNAPDVTQLLAAIGTEVR